MTWTVNGKTMLVTGATSGIGLETCVELAKLGATVVMVGRNPEKTQRAVADIKARSGTSPAGSLICDFASQVSIRKLASEYRSRYDRLDVLVNNAGGVQKNRTVTEDGVEATLAVNHLGYFLLSNLLLDLLKKSAPSRIVTVASIAHRSGTLDFDNLGFEHGGYGIMRAYSRSKLCNVLFASELARRLDGAGVTSNSLHPGGVNTNIWSDAPAYVKPLVFLLKPFMLSPKEGARTIVQLSADPALEGITGRYFEKMRPVAPAPRAQDEALARRLWDVSLRLVGQSIGT